MVTDIYKTDKKYSIIYADPPWKYVFSKSSSRAVTNHYPVMTPEEMEGVPVPIERKSHSIHQIIMSPVQEHSKKPEIVRDKIVELFGELPRIELFARQCVDGWDCWGNEV